MTRLALPGSARIIHPVSRVPFFLSFLFCLRRLLLGVPGIPPLNDRQDEDTAGQGIRSHLAFCAGLVPILTRWASAHR